MKVFISSVVRGLEAERDAASQAAASLGNEVRRSEDFVSSAHSPQEACLAGVRWSDAVVLLLGSRYGDRQASGLSATHEEYREAKESGPVLAFVEDDVVREPPQEAFIREVQDWQGGIVTGSFSSPEVLAERITRALHELEMGMATGPLDENEMLDRARGIAEESSSYQLSTPALRVTTVFGPRQQVLRPSELEDHTLIHDLHQSALLGPHALFDTAAGVEPRLEGSALILDQPSASLVVDETGTVVVRFPAVKNADRLGLPALIEEDVLDQLTRALRLTASVADRLDSAHRLTHALPVVTLSRAGSYGWRTREEQLRNPNQMEVSMHAGDQIVVQLAPPVRPRAALTHEASTLAEDFVVLLRREYK
jgi:Domain of unknown function (DUF4062)